MLTPHPKWKKHGYPGAVIDSLVVDEVQDFTQAELRLFLECCSDKNGLFLTGDTCQTIARGVGFRFEDVRRMFCDDALHKIDIKLPIPKKLIYIHHRCLDIDSYERALTMMKDINREHEHCIVRMGSHPTACLVASEINFLVENYDYY